MSRFSSYLLWRVIIQNAAYHHSKQAFIIQMLVIFIHVAVIINLVMVIKIQGAVIIVNYMACHHTCDGISSFYDGVSSNMHGYHNTNAGYHHTDPGFHHTCSGFLHLDNGYHNTYCGISLLSYGVSSYTHRLSSYKCRLLSSQSRLSPCTTWLSTYMRWVSSYCTKMFVKTNSNIIIINSTFDALKHATVTLGIIHLVLPILPGGGAFLGNQTSNV